MRRVLGVLLQFLKFVSAHISREPRKRLEMLAAVRAQCKLGSLRHAHMFDSEHLLPLSDVALTHSQIFPFHFRDFLVFTIWL
jgi:hypothetical protein